MLLIVVRHGEAEPKSSQKADEERGLTDEGSRKLRINLSIAREFAGLKVDLILSSALVRARQSAEIAKEVFGTTKVEVDPSLGPQATPYELYQDLSKYSQFECVLLVSHQPFLSSLLASLLNWDDRYFSFQTGALAIIQIGELTTDPKGVLLALLPSR